MHAVASPDELQHRDTHKLCLHPTQLMTNYLRHMHMHMRLLCPCCALPSSLHWLAGVLELRIAKKAMQQPKAEGRTIQIA